MNFNPGEKALSLKLIAGIVLAVLIAGYGLFEAYDILRGPSLTVSSPQDGQTVHDALVRVEGRATRIAKIWVVGRPIFAQSDGRFSEPLLLGNGYNIIEVRAEDQFGRQISKKVRVVLE